MFTKAIVRTPCPEMIHGITSAFLGQPNYRLALEQHTGYVGALRSLGLDVMVLEADNRFPDSVFVEDVALCTREMAVITQPGAPSRRGEERELAGVLRLIFKHLEYIRPPGTLEAGDVMMVGNHCYIGLSDRTNREGADQLISILSNHGMSGEKLRVGGLLHLKSGVSYLEDHVLLAGKQMFDHPSFTCFRKIGVPEEEAYAANSIWVNGTVLVPSGFPRTRERIENAGIKTVALQMSEFMKLDGGLSCLSLRY